MAAATKYLFPCPCGQAHTIDISQAGQTIACTCGKAIEIPAMRVIRTLEPAAPSADKAPVKDREPADWSPVQGSLFAGGLLLAVVGLGLGAYFGWVVSQIDVSPPPPEIETREIAQIDRMPPEQMFEIFRNLQKEGIGPRHPPVHIQLQQIKTTYTQYLTASLVAAGLGIVMAGSSLVMKPSAPPSRR